ncbi:MAG: FAD-binding oxidoreductase [Bacteroidetes bacterium]|nr:FAD-binding oxidoreductase [Bacteroidota bacterium]
MKDLLIVGQGLAGSVLALKAWQRGLEFMVSSDPARPSWTRIAAGLFNPVTGRRFVKTWMADTLFEEIYQFYPWAESVLGDGLYHPRPIYRVFTSRQQRLEFLNKVDQEPMGRFTPQVFEKGYLPETIHHPEGGLFIPGGGWVDLPRFVQEAAMWLKSHGRILDHLVTPDEVIWHDDHAVWNGQSWRKVIFAEGARADQNRLFAHLPFVLTKGEVLTLKVPNLELNGVVSRGKFILPVGNDLIKVGSTYSWDDTDPVPTEEARKDLVTGFEEICRLPYEIVHHQVGIRPTVKDRRPFIGMHSEFSSACIFNGLGTKGVSLAPYWADRALDHLFDGKPLDKEVDIRRFGEN